MIAWSDRPEERVDDLSDILKIIEHYHDLKWDEIVEKHYDLLINERYDELLISAEVLGRNSKLYLQKSEAISERILDVLETNLEDTANSKIARIWAAKLDKEIKYTFSLLSAIYEGIIG